MSARPPVAVAAGDPAGVGPELIARVLRRRPDLRHRCRVFGGPVPGIRPGRWSGRSGALALEWLDTATRAVLNGECAALMTGPVSKEACALTDRGFRGQTEFVAALAGVKEPVMMLAGPKLRVVCVTRHLPVRRIVEELDTGLIRRAITTTARGLTRWWGIRNPRIAVTGLNPHAGEGGLLGTEDARIVTPAIRATRIRGARITGPHPADTVFAAMLAGRYDAVVAMYHDQANIPVKTVDGWHAVNATLGLPFLRTSPAHGTAFDLAGTGRADPASVEAALEQALRAANRGPA